MKKIRVLLVDDHKIFRDGILSLFSGAKEIEIIDVASNSNEALQKIRNQKPDVVIMDISMPEISGIEIIKQIKEENISSKILVLSMHTKEEYVFNAIRAGANGYLPKEETSKEELFKAIKEIIAGKEYFSNSISTIMQKYFLRKAKNNENDSVKDYEQLTKREKEVLKLVIEGLSNIEIADKLFVNIRTIETHKHNLLQKLKIKNTIELVKFALKNNILEF
ncbi:MAG: response regulator transcription factor [Bacteroidota bacterium]|nr:response regulator transcription factor [Bacteroidota bacterium]